MSALLLPNRTFLHYEVLGRGMPPVLFLHTWVGSWRYWLATMEELSINHRTYALDFAGFGSTLGGHLRQELDDYLEQVEYFIQSMELREVVLVGHGLGAVVAIALAARHRERVQRLVTIGAPLQPGWNAALPSGAVEALARLVGRKKEAFYTDLLLPEVRRVSPQAYQAALQASAAVDVLALARETTQPWLALYGSQDPIFQHIMERNNGYWPLPSSPAHHVLVFERSGHFPMLEAPRPFHRLLRDFLGLPAGGDLRDLQLRDEWRRRFR
ncbi:MAG: alpha/beta hydrolase [Chloroflexi bacterium]|nr:alpha/beta hydrolase [Chloroflexota bacterium]